jgi:hypothetical protein
MKDLEEDPAARELKELLCATCYRSLIDWISERSAAPFVPCDPCAPIASRWLERRRKDRSS